MKNIFNIITAICCLFAGSVMASSHREAPLIADDPLADNADVYAFRSPDKPNTVTFIATYVPIQLPQGGPNYYSFGENIRYEIHIDNNASKPGDEIIYRFEFKIKNEDPTTFFNIRLGKQNLKTTYTLSRSDNGGQSFVPILVNRPVPPNNIGDRSIKTGVGLGVSSYESLVKKSIAYTATGEQVYCGPSDDPFFVDLGGAAFPAQNILDGNHVIGVWASASRQQVRTLNTNGTQSYSGPWVQVSRLGMPLTNEVVVPVGYKDYWNSLTPYQELADTQLDNFFYNPELGLYMDDALFGGAVPAFSPLRIQRNSLGAFDFGNGKDGLFALKGSPAVAGTALDDAVFGTLLLPGAGKPRSVDLWPIFHTGVPNVRPYQLATGKGGNPLAAGKPFINNFLPNGGDMLRLNMATPVTPRNSPDFSTLGIVNAAVRGLTQAPYNTNSNLQFIPNMDGFPNGRRLEDDVTLIELQAVSGVALAAIGLWYDDYTPGGSPVTPKLLNVLTYNTGVGANDLPFRSKFPYVALPHAGDGACGGMIAQSRPSGNYSGLTGAGATELRSDDAASTPIQVTVYPNPFVETATFNYTLETAGDVNITVFDQSGKLIATLENGTKDAGNYETRFNAGKLPSGLYYARIQAGTTTQVTKLFKN